MSSRIGTYLIGYYEPKCTSTDKFLQPPLPLPIYIGKGNVNSHTSLSIASKLWPTDQLAGSTVTSLTNRTNRTLLETTTVLQLFQIIKRGMLATDITKARTWALYWPEHVHSAPPTTKTIQFFSTLILSFHSYQHKPLHFTDTKKHFIQTVRIKITILRWHRVVWYTGTNVW